MEYGVIETLREQGHEVRVLGVHDDLAGIRPAAGFFEASAGISQASVVENADQLARRVQFIHESLGTAAIVEQFIDGRELYVGVLGNERLEVLPVWEMSFAQMPDNRWRIATERVKWNTQYQKKNGIMTNA